MSTLTSEVLESMIEKVKDLKIPKKVEVSPSYYMELQKMFLINEYGNLKLNEDLEPNCLYGMPIEINHELAKNYNIIW